MRNKYFLLRHGETIYQTKKKDIHYPRPGTIPVGLTARGREQIKAAAKKLKSKKTCLVGSPRGDSFRVDLIYSSDFLRTRQTSEIVAKELDLKVNFDKRLRDLNIGTFHGRPKEGYRRFFSSRKEKFFKRPSGGENWDDVKKRIVDFIKDIEKKHKNKTVLIVSHGDPLWLLSGVIKGLSQEELLKKKYKGLFRNVGELKEIK